MTDRTDCKGCKHLRILIAEETKNVYFRCGLSNIVVGRYRKKSKFYSKPKPTNKHRCSYSPVEKCKKGIFQLLKKWFVNFMINQTKHKAKSRRT